MIFSQYSFDGQIAFIKWKTMHLFQMIKEIDGISTPKMLSNIFKIYITIRYLDDNI